MNNFLTEIRIFPFNFAPHYWAFCNGQLLPISQNTAIFSLLGTTYGGNGTTNFGLPNLQNASMLQQGQGAGLSNYDLGEQSGSSSVTLIQTEMPVHTHDPRANALNTPASASGDPTNRVWGVPVARRPQPNFYASGAATADMHPLALGTAGGNGSHNNLMPYIGINFCIALTGIYPARP